MADKNKFFGSRAFQKGGMAVIFTACVVALVILINLSLIHIRAHETDS